MARCGFLWVCSLPWFAGISQSATRCGGSMYKIITLVVISLFANSWSTCTTTNWVVTKSRNGGMNCGGFPQCGQSTISISECGNGVGGGSCTTGTASGTCGAPYCVSSVGANTLCNSNNTWYQVSTTCCNTQVESDSVECALDPTLPKCIQTIEHA